MPNVMDLLTFDSPIRAPANIVYSTDPRRAEGQDGRSYVIKGPELEVVFAEIAGCLLAAEVGIPVPEVAVCRFNGQMFAGSVLIEDGIRDVSPWLKQPKNVSNFGDAFGIVVVDAWLANTDRNLGNVLGRQVRGSNIEFVMIDFEKSATLRPNPIIQATNVEPARLWPTETLGRALRDVRPLTPPEGTMNRITTLEWSRCAAIVNDVVEAIGIDVPWSENSIHAITWRAERIRQLTGELWRLR